MRRRRRPWSSKQRDAERGAVRDTEEGRRRTLREKQNAGAWSLGPVAVAAVFVRYGGDKDAVRWVDPFLLFLCLS
jgi:hypothetical protein